MNTKLNLDSTSSIMTVAAAALAAFIAVGVFSAVAGLFQSRGAPLERLAAAERACISHAYQSERASCMRQLIAESERARVARK